MTDPEVLVERAEDQIRTVVVVVGIETYQFSKPPHSVTGVLFATRDAQEMASTLKQQFGVQDDDLYLWTNQDVTKARLENDLPYIASGLGPNDRLVFYYAGHGFFVDGTNRLTAWDTHPRSLANTTVCLRKVLLEPLTASACSQALLFIDACAVPMGDGLPSRDLLASFNETEFEDFINSREYLAVYMSCSPGEKSYPSRKLEHGIWTWHLLRALRGEAKEALSHREWLTDCSLKDYLRGAVEKFIREQTEITSRQRPHASIQASHTFNIIHFPERTATLADLPIVGLAPSKAYFRRVESTRFDRLPGFSKKAGHFIPESPSRAAAAFGSKLMTDDIVTESKQVFDSAKAVLKLKRTQISRTCGEGGATVDTDIFRMAWSTDQHAQDPRCMTLSRSLRLRSSPDDLPETFDSIFPVAPTELVIPIEGAIDYDEFATRLEELEGSGCGTFSEDQDVRKASFTLNDGTLFEFMIDDGELVVTAPKTRGCLALLDVSVRALKGLNRAPVATLLLRGNKE